MPYKPSVVRCGVGLAVGWKVTLTAAPHSVNRIMPVLASAGFNTRLAGARIAVRGSVPHHDPTHQECRMLPELRVLYFEDLAVGLSEDLHKVISSSDVVGFAEVTGDRNPIHLSEHFAARTPFGHRIAHGLYTASLISAVLGTRLPGPGAIYISQTLNFRAPVKIGDEVVVRVEVAELIPERRRARLACTCSVEGEVVLDGEAWIKVPSRAEAPRSPLGT